MAQGKAGASVILLPLLVSVALLAAPAVQAQSPNQILVDAEKQMQSAIDQLKIDLSAITASRATPGMFAKVVVNYYGAPTPVPQLATISIPEARMAVIKPFDTQMLAPIASAVSTSLGISPSNDGIVLRVVLPQMTEERRRELINTARQKTDAAKVAIRNVRRKTRDQLEGLVRAGTATAADVTKAEKDLDSLTNRYAAQADELEKAKEQELL
ncbi:MAG: ribosome-recycling factor [Bryobacteraceae bacterium]